MEKLRVYLRAMTPDQREAFAKACGTSVSYLFKAISAKQQFRAGLAVAIHRESRGQVSVRDLVPSADWKAIGVR